MINHFFEEKKKELTGVLLTSRTLQWSGHYVKLLKTCPQYMFTIINDKLYLNYNQSINEKWTKDRSQYIIDADKNWPRLLDK